MIPIRISLKDIPSKKSLKKLREMTNKRIDDLFRESRRMETPEVMIKEIKRESID